VLAKFKKETGATLLELVVVMVLIGILLPGILALLSQFAIHSVQNPYMEQAIALAEQRMEEVIGRKNAQWNWYLTPNQFDVAESIAGGFTRTTAVNAISNWGAAQINAWEVRVTVSHPQLTKGNFFLVTRITKYH
jgi:type II secretory pathway pseudopilin PulG